MRIDLVRLPQLIRPEQIEGRSVVVFDVLRATTNIVAALEAGAKAVRVFETIEATRGAAGAFEGGKLLAGERLAVRIEGFDVGNSPREMTSEVAGGRTVFMTTTNGTRALLACTAAASVYAGSLWNEAAMARRLRVDGRDVLLVCAGTDGVFAEEDEAAAASLAMRLQSLTPAVGLSTTAQAAVEAVADRDLLPIFRASDGGRNLIAAGLEDDIPVSARRRELPFVARLKEGGIIHREEVQTSV